ncbi:hypothetical protein BDY21DRAFT_202284 [Lineolata rhizophorae]|uniref:Uncharacterized protein n=1 Tax=Lineolata rhizophorae TaxID=578093 RepID=A0A6A6P579_9PEZI|nr:hypothetical protein BDY21DRAFT_202284 [Lineolata rhizophorae]
MSHSQQRSAAPHNRSAEQTRELNVLADWPEELSSIHLHTLVLRMPHASCSSSVCTGRPRILFPAEGARRQCWRWRWWTARLVPEAVGRGRGAVMGWLVCVVGAHGYCTWVLAVGARAVEGATSMSEALVVVRLGSREQVEGVDGARHTMECKV